MKEKTKILFAPKKNFMNQRKLNIGIALTSFVGLCFLAVTLFTVNHVSKNQELTQMKLYEWQNNSVVFKGYLNTFGYKILLKNQSEQILAQQQDGGKECTIDSDCNSISNRENKCSKTTINNTTGVCKCANRYIKSDCSYKQSSQLIAFILSILLGEFGVDRFYLEYTTIGIIKLLIPLLFCCAGCCVGIFFGCGAGLCACCCSDDDSDDFFRDTTFEKFATQFRQDQNREKGVAIGTSIGLCCFVLLLVIGVLTGAIWWLVDWILIVSNSIPDGNGIPMYRDI